MNQVATAEPGSGPDPKTRPRPARTWTSDLAVRALAVLLVAFVARQVFATFATPAFSGHDEVAHTAYLYILAGERRVPVMPDLAEWRQTRVDLRSQLDDDDDEALLPGDDIPDAFYPWCRYVLDWYCEPDHQRWASSPPRVVSVRGEYFPSGWLYTANHPPLYYLLMTPAHAVAKAFGLGLVGEHYLLRLATIPFGIVTVIFTFLIARAIFPTDRFLLLTAPAFVAFQPQIAYEGAIVNNDILSIAIFSWLLWLIVTGTRDGFPVRRCLWIGVALGLGLLAKSTTVIAIPVIAFAIIATTGWRDWRAWTRRGLLAAGPAAMLSAPWYAFMLRTYGSSGALDRVADLQGWWNQPLGSFLGLLLDPGFAAMRFRETWGEYGWRMIPLGPGTLGLIAAGTLICVGGLYLYATLLARGLGNTSDPVETPVRWQQIALWSLFIACAAGYLAVVQFGTQFALSQARYYFPVAAAAAVLAMVGLRTAIPPRWRRWGPAVTIACLLLLNLWLFVAYLLPFHSSRPIEMPWLTDSPTMVTPADPGRWGEGA
jgi:4-amino-4-deoxy-L-arabinose transferase-like glycosyltransferase